MSSTLTVDPLEQAFEDYLETGREPPELAQYRAMSEGTDNAGGRLVPPVVRAKLVERMKAFGGIAAAAEEITTTDGAWVLYPVVDDTANAGDLVAEGGTMASGADFVFTNRLLSAYKYMAGGGGNLPLKVSWELDQDSVFPLQDFIVRKLAERMARAQAPHWAVGTGIQQPQGLVTPITTLGAIASNAVGPTYAELLATTLALDSAYRRNASWVMNDTTLGKIRALADTAGRPLITGGPVRSLLGYPVIVDQAMPNITAGAKFLAFGDIREAYVIRRVKDVTIVILDELFAPNAQIGYMAWARADGAVANVNAVVVRSGA